MRACARVIGAAIVAFTIVGGMAHAEESGATEERYHVGIGVELWKVDETIVGFYKYFGDESVKIENTDGRFTGSILVSGMLDGGPAAEAGVEGRDIVVSVDGEDAKQLGVDAIVAKIKNGTVGEEVRLTLGRLNRLGGVERTVDVAVPRRLIDGVAWLPKDTWLSSSSCEGPIGGDAKCVSVESKLTEDTSTGEFFYHYRVSNERAETMYIQWETLGIASSQGFWDGLLVPIRPNETREFVLRSVLVPMFYVGGMCQFEEQMEIPEYFRGEGFSEPKRGRWDGIPIPVLPAPPDGRIPTAPSLEPDTPIILKKGCTPASGFVPRKYSEAFKEWNGRRN